jgi:pimeloyl-ACP methyl ester carboxylesterase
VAGQFDQLGIDLRAYARHCRDPRVLVIKRASHLAPLTHRGQVAAILRDAVLEASAR